MPQKVMTVGDYTVYQMATLEGCRMRIHKKNMEKKRDAITKKYKDGEEMSVEDQALMDAYDEWEMVASCVTPFIPLDDYLVMPITETRPILDAVNDCNADMLTNTPKKN